MDQTASCIAIAALLLIQLSSAQKRFMFPYEDYVTTENHLPVPSVRIPEKLLLQLNSVQSVAEFLNKFVEPEENVIEEKGQRRIISGGGRGIISGRKASPRGRKTNTNHEIKEKITYMPFTEDQSVISKERAVIEAYYDPRNPERFQDTKPVVIPVEHHTKCACKCVQSPETCKEFQKFDEENCRCVCINRKLAPRCTQHKIWDDSKCTCKCRERLDCSTFRYFNEDKCKCELNIW